MELNEIKSYLKIDFDDDDRLILDLLSAAEEYLANAGVKKNCKSNLYKLALRILVSHWYLNRNVITVGTTSSEVDYSLKRIIIQLQTAGDDF